MSGTTDPPTLVAVVVGTGPVADAIAEELHREVPELAGVRTLDRPTSPHDDASTSEGGPSGLVGLVIIAAGAADVDETVRALDADPSTATASTLLVSERRDHDDVADAIDRDRLDAVIGVPWTAGELGRHARKQLSRWVHDHHPSHPLATSLQDEAGRRLELPSSELLRDLELDPEALTAELLAGIERVLGPRPRLRLPAGTRLTHEGRGVDAVLVVLRGHVALHRASEVGDLRLHHASTGPVVGLLALAHQRQAFFTARSTSEVEVVHLSLEQLDRALREAPEVGAAMAAVSIRALAGRLRRAEQLQVEKIELNRELDAERRRLADALHQLEQARLDLVEQARFATLGELAAGIAHELNNPVAALTRAAAYVGSDLDRLLAPLPQADRLQRARRTAHDRAPRSTAEERATRRRLAEVLGDRRLADRLVAVGLEDEQDALALAALDDEELALVETAAGIGAALRNLEVAAGRIGSLVASLRAYARPDGDPVDDVDLHAGLDDTLRLTAHRLRGIEVERDYGALPNVRCHPGQLDQVWTNLLVNAAEELGGEGRITVRTDTPDPEHVRVQVIDDGPGIDPDVLPRVFEPRFTTKQGTVRYGLGLGLAITRRIVGQHGGTITLDSEPGRTVATVTLPVAGPET